jgi:2-polyprenyl-6-methoxyphenol hydroxylase-like FAD-dependent oxidoreductase
MRSTLPILIIGAGPSGLTLASILARHDVPFRLIDNDPGPTTQSRASVLHVRTLELLDKLDFTREALERGVAIDGVNVFVRGRHAAYFPMASAETEPSPYPYVLSLEQAHTENLLYQDVLAHGGLVEWNTELVGLTPHTQEVHVVLRGPDGSLEELTCAWLVGADGSRSLVRRLLNIPFVGGTYEQVAFLADVHLAPDFQPDKQNLNLSNYGFVGILPLGQGRYRLFGALAPEYASRFQILQEGAAIPLPDLQQWFREYFYLPNQITRVDWTAIYRTHRRLADHYRSGRCFLIGDAAHLHSPAGGQGLNLGVGDGFNLGWKLALAVRGELSEAALDSYEYERRAVAQKILSGADRGFELEATKNPLVEAFRLYMLPTLINCTAHLGPVRRAIFNVFSQTWIRYADSPLVGERTPEHGSQPGDRAPFGHFEDGPLLGQGLYTMLRGLEHQLLFFEHEASETQAKHLAERLRAVTTRYRVPLQLQTISGANRELHQRYQIARPTVVMIRPDGYIAYRGRALDLDALARYMDRWFHVREESDPVGAR